MTAVLDTSVNELSDSRVRVDVAVPGDEVERRINAAAKALGRDMKIPGFRQGKVPAELVMQRAGRPAVIDEAVRAALPEWFQLALLNSGIEPVGDPSISIEGIPDPGAELKFSIEIGVCPPAKLGDYKGLEVGKGETEVSDEELDQELNVLRERSAKLEPVERAAAKGDFAVIDYEGTIEGEPFEGSTGAGKLVEVGAGQLLQEIDSALEGTSAGDDTTVKATLDGQSLPPELADKLGGKEAEFKLSVKEIREKQLPELDDDFALEAGGFETLEEMREDIRARVLEVKSEQTESLFRAAAVDAAAQTSKVDLPKELIEGRARELWSNLQQSLAQRGMNAANYLQITGKTEQEMLEEAIPDAELTLRREATLRAIVEEQSLSPSDDEIAVELDDAGIDEDGVTGKELLEQARETGRLESLRRSLAERRAVDLIVENAKPIPLAEAEAKEAIWTPEKERSKAEIWTPDS